MVKRGISRPNAQILEEASSWFVELSEGAIGNPARKAFDDWLRVSPEHVRAFLQISALWEDVTLLGRGRSLDAEALIEWAAARPSVVRLESPENHPPRRSAAGRVRRCWTRPGWLALVASLLITTAGLGIWVHLQQGLYTTGIGEQRPVTLSDGSTIDLNAQSRLRVRFSAQERDVDLLEGQAFFHVVADAERPFVVRSGAARIRDVGTQFDVDREGAETTVTVVEGRVAVLRMAPGAGSAVPQPVTKPIAPPSGASRAVEQPNVGALGIELAAGEQITVTPNTVTPPARADVSAAIAWTQRTLVFMSSPLSEVAREYNRYHERPLVILDPALANLHVSGVFSVTDSAGLIAFLCAQPDVAVKETSRDVEVLSR